MVPFDLRLMHAELPQYVGKSHDTLDRLHHLLTVIKKVCMALYVTTIRQQRFLMAFFRELAEKLFLDMEFFEV
jgi:hypothetical protein